MCQRLGTTAVAHPHPSLPVLDPTPVIREVIDGRKCGGERKDEGPLGQRRIRERRRQRGMIRAAFARIAAAGIRHYGTMSIRAPFGTARQISSISALVTATHPSVQSCWRWSAPTVENAGGKP